MFAICHRTLLEKVPVVGDNSMRNKIKKKASTATQTWKKLFAYGQRKARAAGIRSEKDVERLIDAERRRKLADMKSRGYGMTLEEFLRHRGDE